MHGESIFLIRVANPSGLRAARRIQPMQIGRPLKRCVYGRNGKTTNPSNQAARPRMAQPAQRQIRTTEDTEYTEKNARDRRAVQSRYVPFPVSVYSVFSVVQFHYSSHRRDRCVPVRSVHIRLIRVIRG